MTDDRLPDVLRVYEAALALEGAERAEYLETRCGADADLRREVEALLQEPSAVPRSLLDTPPWRPPALEAGQRLGPYEVVGLLGAGGMGTVYRARDTRLKRTVAIKVLAEATALDPVARAGLTREAQAIAALDHPHICAIHDVGQDVPTNREEEAGRRAEGGGRRVQPAIDYLVMEYLEGPSLATYLELRRRKATRSLTDVLDIAGQIADALAAAHRKGIVHRDLKPSNVMLTSADAAKRGTPHVKLLDFGLAKLAPPAVGGTGRSSAAMLAMTTSGAVMGTVPYMAPEQLEGRDVDARADGDREGGACSSDDCRRGRVG